MPKVKITLPAKTLGSVPVRVRITDINYGNHLGNDSVVSIVHDARVQWLHANGYSELDLGGCGLIMRDLEVQFRNESFYGDVIDVTLYAGETGTAGFELYYQLIANREGKTVLIALAKTGMVCYDYSAKKIVPVPAAFAALLTAD